MLSVKEAGAQSMMLSRDVVGDRMKTWSKECRWVKFSIGQESPLEGIIKQLLIFGENTTDALITLEKRDGSRESIYLRDVIQIDLF